MQISNDGIAFIAAFEGLRLYLYDDGGPGVGNATIGIGHLVHEGPIDGRPSEAPYANGITQDQAYALFRTDVASRVDWVNARTTRVLTQNQFDAMVDFTFNCGYGAYEAIAPVVNAFGNVCAAIAPYINPPWASDALRARRDAECRLFYGPITPTVPQEDEMWHRHNEVANNAYWQGGRHTFGQGETATLNLPIDLPHVMAHNPSAIDFDLYTEGATLQVEDGNGAFAGNCDGRRRNAVIRAVPVNGQIRMKAIGGPVTVFLGVTGYLD